jgi:hypothetical protein
MKNIYIKIQQQRAVRVCIARQQTAEQQSSRRQQRAADSRERADMGHGTRIIQLEGKP